MPKVFVSGTSTFTHEAKVQGLRPHKQEEQHFSEIISVPEAPVNSDSLTEIKVRIVNLLDAPSWANKVEVQINCLSILS